MISRTNVVGFFITMLFMVAVVLPAMANPPVVNLVKDASGTKNVTANIIINAPPSVVWKVITDYGNFIKFMPGIKECNILQSSGSAKTAKIKMDVSSLMKPFNYEAKFVENCTTKTVTMTRTAGDFNHLKLTYSLKPLDNGTKTMASYTLQIDHGKGIPDIFANKALKNNASKTLTAVENESIKLNSDNGLANK